MILKILSFLKRQWKTLALVVMALYLYAQNNHISTLKMRAEESDKYKRDYSLLERTWKEQDTTIASQRVQLASMESEIYKIAQKNTQLVKLQSQVRAKQEVRIDSVLIPYALERGQYTDSIPVPQRFEKVDLKGFYSINGKVEKTGVLIDSLKLESDVQVTIGYKRDPGLKGYFSRKVPTVEVVGNNPYMKINKVSNVVFQKDGCTACKLKWIVSGALIGAVAAHLFLH